LKNTVESFRGTGIIKPSGGTISMTKADLINQISEKAGITRVKAETVVNTIFDSMIEALMRDDRIEIRGFGSFVNRQYGAYQGRNPRTGEIINVGEKKLPFFKVGKELKEDVNKKSSGSSGSGSSNTGT
jgi:integration host factor subunit beta